MIVRILFAAIFAGLAAGILLTAMQDIAQVPLIREAETYEGQPPQATAGHDHDAAAAEAPGGGTALANMLAGIGFGMLLTAALVLRSRFVPRGISFREGLLWGLGGYAAFVLAPAVGLPPALPGMAEADLTERQVWWLLAAACTATGLLLVAFQAGLAAKLMGGALILAPQLLAPVHPAGEGDLPPGLIESFLWATLATNLLFWLLLALILLWALRKIAGIGLPPAAPSPGPGGA